MRNIQNCNSCWNEIKDIKDINDFMERFGWFSDSCLKELHLWTEHFVEKDLSMAISPNLDCKIKVLFQRQDTNPSAIEMLFEQVTRVNIIPSPENYDSIIFSATLISIDGTFYWADDEAWKPDDPSKYAVSWISSKKIKWRDVSEWMGAELRYGSI